MSKSSGNCGHSYSANRSSGCPYSGNRGGCSSNNRPRADEPRCASEPRSRGCDGEYLNRVPSCRADEYSRVCADAACGYVWRGTERSGCSEPCAQEYESCPAELHVHEVQGSVQAAGERCSPHTHRFACVSCEPILLRDGRHAHKLTFRTDSCEGHCHEFSGMTTGEYEICGCHVHYIEGETSRQAGHCHQFRCVTQIENPVEAE